MVADGLQQPFVGVVLGRSEKAWRTKSFGREPARSLVHFGENDGVRLSVPAGGESDGWTWCGSWAPEYGRFEAVVAEHGLEASSDSSSKPSTGTRSWVHPPPWMRTLVGAMYQRPS